MLDNIDSLENWADLQSDENLFNQAEEVNEDEIEEVKDETNGNTSTEDNNTQTDNKETEETDLFATEENNEESDEIEEQETDVSDLTVLKTLKDKGFIDIDDEKFKDIKEDEIDEILEESYYKNLDNRIKELIDDLPDENKKGVELLLKGASIEDIAKSVINNSITITEDLDLEEEENQELVMKSLLRQEGYDEDYIDTQINFLKEKDKLKDISTKKYEKWIEKQKIAKQTRLKQIEDEVKRQKEQEKLDRLKYREVLNTVDEIGGLKIPKKKKSELVNYISKKEIKLANGQYITKLQKEMLSDLPQNNLAYIQFAIMMKNRKEDGTFDFEKIKKELQTNVTRKVKDEIRRNKNSIVPKKSAGTRRNYQSKSLADLL